MLYNQHSMKDLGPELQGSGLQAELLKAKSYQNGKTVGSQAGEPPADLNRVTRTSFLPSREPEFRISSWEKQDRHEPRVHEEPIPEKIAYRQGFFDGLREFLAQHGISLREAGAFNFPDVLTSKAGFDGFVQGLNRRKPAVGRDYTRRRGELSYKYEPEPKWIARQRFNLSQTLSGYELGFILSLAKDFGVKLNYLEVPRDNMAYEAFMQGLSAESREIPLKRDHLKEKYHLIEESPYEIFEMVDNNAYLAGLKAWLANQGLRVHIEAWQVRHPEALRAFKAALEERVLPEYEPRELVIPTTPHKEELIKNYPRKDPIEKLYLPPSPFDELRRQGASGYSLGKAARELRQTLGASTQRYLLLPDKNPF